MTKPDADEGKLYLRVFAYRPTVPMAGDLEGRMKRFLSSSPLNENLDDPQFAAATGSSFKADYLLSSRAIIAELKALQLGTAKQRVEDRLRVRFARRDAPMVFGGNLRPIECPQFPGVERASETREQTDRKYPKYSIPSRFVRHGDRAQR